MGVLGKGLSSRRAVAGGTTIVLVLIRLAVCCRLRSEAAPFGISASLFEFDTDAAAVVVVVWNEAGRTAFAAAFD